MAEKSNTEYENPDCNKRNVVNRSEFCIDRYIILTVSLLCNFTCTLFFPFSINRSFIYLKPWKTLLKGLTLKYYSKMNVYFACLKFT